MEMKCAFLSGGVTKCACVCLVANIPKSLGDKLTSFLTQRSWQRQRGGERERSEGGREGGERKRELTHCVMTEIEEEKENEQEETKRGERGDGEKPVVKRRKKRFKRKKVMG